MRRIRIFSIAFYFASAILFFLYLYNTRQILDNQGPEIIMDSSTIEMSVKEDESAVLADVTAWDDRDGDVTDYLLIEQFSNFIEKGRRQVTIAAVDMADNVTKATREVIYTDYESPKYSITAPFTFPANTNSVTKYITASDCLDGDLTSYIKLTSEEGITLATAGMYKAIFTVSNSAGDTVQLPVTIEIYNSADRSRQPNILLKEYLVYVEKGQKFEADSYIEEVYYGNRSFKRQSDGRLHYKGPESLTLPDLLSTDDFEIDNPVDTDTPGVYEVTYSYSWEESVPGTTRLIVVVTE